MDDVYRSNQKLATRVKELEAEIGTYSAREFRMQAEIERLKRGRGRLIEVQEELIEENKRLSDDIKNQNKMLNEQVAIMADLNEDAKRYRWLREQHWNYSDLVVVTRPRQNVKLGSDCPCDDRLDAAIDAAMEGE